MKHSYYFEIITKLKVTKILDEILHYPLSYLHLFSNEITMTLLLN